MERKSRLKLAPKATDWLTDLKCVLIHFVDSYLTYHN